MASAGREGWRVVRKNHPTHPAFGIIHAVPDAVGLFDAIHVGDGTVATLAVFDGFLQFTARGIVGPFDGTAFLVGAAGFIYQPWQI